LLLPNQQNTIGSFAHVGFAKMHIGLRNKKYWIIWFLMGSWLAIHHGFIMGRAYGHPIQLLPQASDVKMTMLAVRK